MPGLAVGIVPTVRSDLAPANYPIVPGHEVAGVVTAVGSKVTKFSVGDHVGVGCFVDSCLDCRFVAIASYATAPLVLDRPLYRSRHPPICIICLP